MITTLNIHSRYDLETLARMVFKTQDVLNTEKERIRRSASLLKAAVLDSLCKVEVVLTLEDHDSQKRLRSRIIAAGNDRVMLDKGVSIPVNCIKHIEFPNYNPLNSIKAARCGLFALTKLRQFKQSHFCVSFHRPILLFLAHSIGFSCSTYVSFL